MHSTATSIIAVAGIAGALAWHPGVAGEQHRPGPVILAQSGDTRDAASADPPASTLLLAAESVLWDRLRERGGPDELEAYLTLFPQSRFAADVRRRRDELLRDTRHSRPHQHVPPSPPSRRNAMTIDLAAAAGAAAVAPDCGLLAGAANETIITIDGVLQRGQETLVQSMLSALRVPATSVRFRFDAFEGPYCHVLSTLRMYAGTPPPASPPRTMLCGTYPLRDGDNLRIRVEMPEWPSYLSASYLTVSGEVAHLVAELPPRPANESVVLDDPRWRIAEPFGTDLLLVTASELPLFDQKRPAVETVEEFTSALSAALQHGRRTAARTAVRVVVVETAPR